MDIPANAVPGSPLEARAAAAPRVAATRPFYWSVRRELWENRSLYVAPLAVAAVVLFSFLVGTVGLPARVRVAAALEPGPQLAKLATPFSMAASVIILFTYVTSAFY